jgi:uncharacterized protein (DUF427 family)
MEFPSRPFLEPTERRIRVRLGGSLVADSTRAKLLVAYGPGALPTYYLPLEDVRPGALANEEHGADGRTRWDVRVGARGEQRAAWTHPEPTGALGGLAGHVTFSWRQLAWFEEDEQVYVHARDPHKRVDTLHSSRNVRVLVHGEEVANSIRPLLLFETGLPVRYYLPFADVGTSLLRPSDTVSSCPYKGTARYFSVEAGGRLMRDAAWSYPETITENPRIRGLICFYNEKVDLVVDGTALERPESPFS